MEDRQIILLLFNRAEAAIGALSQKFGDRLQRIALNILGNHHDAEEAVNDTYLALWNAIPPENPNPLSAYVYRTGRNIALKMFRTNTAQKRDSRYDLSIEELAEILPGDSLEETLDARILGQAISRFLDRLKPEQSAVFLRRYWFGDSVKDISRDLGVSENTLSVRLCRIRSQLKDYLCQEGFYEP